MKLKNTNSIRLHKMATIKSVQQSVDNPTELTIAGYASFYQNDFGIKELDRDSEIVNVDGLDVTSFEKNPVLLWNHNWDKPTGQVTKMVKDHKGLYVEAKMQRLTGREDEFENVLHGNVKSFSIGFIPYEIDYLDDALEITKSELIELSLAPVQSNRSALFQVVGTKSLDVDSKDLKELLEQKQKDDSVIIKGKEPQAEPKVEPKAETKVEPKAEPVIEAKVEPKAETKVEPKAEPVIEVKNELDVTALATQLVEAQNAADKIKKEAEDKIQADKEAADQAEAEQAKQKIEDVYSYINGMKDKIQSTPVNELDTAPPAELACCLP